MQITIHRGINQIGGCITEIATSTSKILIDLGHNLPKGNKSSYDELANIGAIEKLTKGCNAIFYTHYHGDHVDLFKYVPDTVPQYIGEIAKQVMICKNTRLANSKRIKEVTKKDVEKIETFRTFRDRQKKQIGDITISPYFVSHSACDAYMFLIEADGKRVLHMGDFREHGYLGKGLEKTLQKYIIKEAIDVLIIEGTMLGRKTEEVKHEAHLKLDISDWMKKFNYFFVLASSTDMDRLATIHQACKDNSIGMLCDGYQKEMLDIFKATSGQLHPLFLFDEAYFYKKSNLKQWGFIKKKGFCMLIRSAQFSLLKKLLDKLPKEECFYIHSMWDGYLKGENQKQEYVAMWNLFDDNHREIIHTSGHATVQTIEKVCTMVNPTSAIIPIHSEQSKELTKLNITEELKKKIVMQSSTQNDIEIVIHDRKDFYRRKKEYLKSIEAIQLEAMESLASQPILTWEEKKEQIIRLRNEQLDKLT